MAVISINYAVLSGKSKNESFIYKEIPYRKGLEIKNIWDQVTTYIFSSIATISKFITITH